MAELDKRIEGILLQRLAHIIKVWCAEFDRTDDGDSRREAPVRDVLNKRRGDKRVKEEKVISKPLVFCLWCSYATQFLEGNMTLKPIVHEIRIQNQVIFLDPPIEYARSTWIHQLHDWLGTCFPLYPSHGLYLILMTGVVCRLRRIQSSRYEIGLQMQGATVVETSYISLVRQHRPCLPTDTDRDTADAIPG